MVKTLKQKKCKMVNFKMTMDQYEALQKIADIHADGNMSSLLRRWIMGAQKDILIKSCNDETSVESNP